MRKKQQKRGTVYNMYSPEDNIWHKGPFQGATPQDTGDDGLTIRFIAEIVAAKLGTTDVYSIEAAVMAYFADARAILLAGHEVRFPFGIGLQLGERFDPHLTTDRLGRRVLVVVRYLQVRTRVYGKFRARQKVKHEVNYETYKALVESGVGRCGAQRKPVLPSTNRIANRRGLLVDDRRKWRVEDAIARRFNGREGTPQSKSTQCSSPTDTYDSDVSLLCVPPTT